jgi:hypothetical protein
MTTQRMISATSTLTSTFTRRLISEALGVSARRRPKGCDKAPIKRMRRRSWVHRPTIGYREPPLVALRRLPNSPRHMPKRWHPASLDAGYGIRAGKLGDEPRAACCSASGI